MRPSWRALPIVGVALVLSGLARKGSSAPEASAARDPFATKIRPILEARCRPCHFEGGKMYGRLPFDRAETVRRLGSARLFTRLKDEKERAAIRAFLGEEPNR